MKRKAWKLSLALLLLVALCGQATTGLGQTSGTPISIAAENVPTNIVWSFWGDPNMLETQKAQVADFETQHPNIKVSMFAAPGSGYVQKILTMIAGGTAPDAMKVDAYYFPQFASQDLLRPLTDLAERDKEFIDSFYEHCFMPSHQLWNGVLYGIPNGASAMGIFFNADMFRAAGLKTPLEMANEGTWTMDAYLDAAIKLTHGEGAERVYGTTASPSIANNSDWIVNNGGSYFNADMTECAFTEPAAMEALQFQLDLIFKYKTAPSPEEMDMLGGVTDSAFMAGRIAMFYNGIWSSVNLRAIDNFEWDVAPLPVGKTGENKSYYKPNSYCIPKDSPNVDAAWEWIKYITGETVERSFIASGTFEAKVKANTDYMIENSPVPNAKYFSDSLANGQVYALPLFENWFEFSQIFNSEMEAVLAGEASLEEAMENAKAEIDPLLTK